jgi:hypothetical protein
MRWRGYPSESRFARLCTVLLRAVLSTLRRAILKTLAFLCLWGSIGVSVVLICAWLASPPNADSTRASSTSPELTSAQSRPSPSPTRKTGTVGVEVIDKDGRYGCKSEEVFGKLGSFASAGDREAFARYLLIASMTGECRGRATGPKVSSHAIGPPCIDSRCAYYVLTRHRSGQQRLY